ncbi:MAG: hypothetical protein OXL38_06245 [Gammaproteobacteria bacterium]|nr:hypothetical protein [Gammaproteobacteria bacterium]
MRIAKVTPTEHDISLLPQGGKSDVTLSADGTLVRKVYNRNDDPVRKYWREVGFYAHYGSSELIPDLVESLPGEQAIVLARAPGVRCSDLQLDSRSRHRLSADHVDKVLQLLSIGGEVTRSTRRYYDDVGASEYRDRVVAALDSYRARTRQAEDVVGRLSESASQIAVTHEVLIKLDWNASNVFVDGGLVKQFIDFEQAFIGTREMLTGILLHNPFWCARTVFAVLCRRGFFPGTTAEIVRYVDFALAAVVADAFERNERPWSEHRLRAAYRRHVVERMAELSAGSR